MCTAQLALRHMALTAVLGESLGEKVFSGDKRNTSGVAQSYLFFTVQGSSKGCQQQRPCCSSEAEQQCVTRNEHTANLSGAPNRRLFWVQRWDAGGGGSRALMMYASCMHKAQ